MLNAYLQDIVTIKRRVSQGRDSLNNPVYGTPTSGAGWSTVYTNMPVKLAFSSKSLQFAQTGERPTPSGIMYYNPSYTLLLEDRILTVDGIEYVVKSIVVAISVPNVTDHYEAILGLP